MRRSAHSILALIITVCGILAAIGITSCANKQQENCRSVNPLADSLLRRGQELYDKNDYTESLTVLKKAHEIFTKEKDSINISLTDRTISECYWRMGEFDNSIVTILEALHIDSLMGNEEHLSSDYHNLAAFYVNKIEIDDRYKQLAKDNIDRAIAIERKLNRHEKLALRYGIASEIYNKLGLYNEALTFARLGYEENKLTGDTLNLYIRQSQIAMSLFRMGHLNEAESIMVDVMQHHKNKQQDLSHLAIDYMDLGLIYVHQKKRDNAIEMFVKGKELSKQLKMYKKVEICALMLSKLYYIDKKYDKYAKELEDVRIARDSISKGQDTTFMSVIEGKVDNDLNVRVIHEQKAKIANRDTFLIHVVILILLSVIILSILHHKKMWPFKVIEKKVKEIVVVEKTFKNAGEEEHSDTFKQQLDKVIQSHLNDPNLSSILLADELSMSQRHLNRKLKETTGKDTANYIREMRIEEAKRLLEHTHDSICEIYMKCGFDNPSYFSRVFKQIVGVSPSEFRKLHP